MASVYLVVIVPILCSTTAVKFGTCKVACSFFDLTVYYACCFYDRSRYI